MKKYIIEEKSMGILAKTKNSVSDKYGNKRKHLVYWGNDVTKETIRFNHLSAILQLILIRILANDLKPTVLQIPNRRKQ